MQTYRAKDGTVHAFPPDATEDQVRAAIAEIDKSHHVMHAPPPVRSDRELYAFNSPFAKEQGLNGLEMLAAAGKSTFGNDQAAADYFASKGGGASAQTDPTTGLPIVVSRTGQRYFLNDPETNLSDVSNFVGNAAAFLPAARFAGAAKTLGGRTLAGVAGTGATDTALQLGTTGRVDPGRAASAAAFGGIGELAAPLFGGIWRAVKTGSMSRQELVRRGRFEIQKLKAQGQLDEETALALGRELDQIQAGGNPRELLSEAEFGFRYTQGQKTGNSRQLTREEMLRNDSTSQAGRLLGANDRFNYDRALGAVDDLQKELTGNAGRVNVVGAVDNAGSVIRREAQDLDGRIDDAYAAFRGTKAYAGADVQRTLPGRVGTALRDFDVSPQTTPAGARAVQLVQQTFAEADQAMSATRLDGFRRRLRSVQATAANPTDRAVTQKVIKEFDTWLDDSALSGMIGGDPKAIALLKDARKLRSEYGVRFGDSGEFATRFDRLVRMMVEDGADPEALARTIYGSSQVSSVWANRAFLRMDMALGKNREAKAQLRAAVLTKLVQGANGDTVTLQQLQNNLRVLLRDNPTLARNVLGPEGAHKVGRLVGALNALLQTADKRSSGTVERLWRYVTQSVTGLPALGRMLETIKSAGDYPAAQRALEPLQPTRPAVIPAIGGAWGSDRGQ